MKIEKLKAQMTPNSSVSTNYFPTDKDSKKLAPETEVVFSNKAIDQIFDNAYELLSFAGYGIAGILLTINGAERTYYNLLEQYDLPKAFALTGVAWGGIIMCFFGISIIYAIKIKYEKTRRMKAQLNLQATDALLQNLAKDYQSERRSDSEESLIQ